VAPSSRGLWVARFVGTSRYCGRPTCFITEAKDEPGPDFKNICDDGAVDARQRWGANVVCGLDLLRLPTYVDAIKTRIAVENFPLFGFIDCTLTRTRRVKYGHSVP
jgi:hypothetical protein